MYIFYKSTALCVDILLISKVNYTKLDLLFFKWRCLIINHTREMDMHIIEIQYIINDH